MGRAAMESRKRCAANVHRARVRRPEWAAFLIGSAPTASTEPMAHWELHQPQLRQQDQPRGLKAHLHQHERELHQ